jgi:amidophosphoribosyltransferase
MIGATNQAPDQLCSACFTGRYPIELPEDGHIGKHVLETLPLTVHTGHDRSVDVDGVALGVGVGGGNALQHP